MSWLSPWIGCLLELIVTLNWLPPWIDCHLELIVTMNWLSPWIGCHPFHTWESVPFSLSHTSTYIWHLSWNVYVVFWSCYVYNLYQNNTILLFSQLEHTLYVTCIYFNSWEVSTPNALLTLVFVGNVDWVSSRTRSLYWD